MYLQVQTVIYFPSPVYNEILFNEEIVSFNIDQQRDDLITVDTESSDHCDDIGSEEDPTFVITD